MLYIVRYGELALKSGRTRQAFEKQLAGNIDAVLKRAGIKHSIERVWGRILVDSNKPADNLIKNVFGVVSFSPCEICKPDIKQIRKLALRMSKIKPGQTFAVRARRELKTGLASQQVNEIVGEAVLKKTKGKVDLENPRHIIGIDVREKAYVYAKSIAGPGGLPEGVEGKLLVIIDRKDDLAAAWLAMRRGCRVIPVFRKKVYMEFFRKWSALPLKYYKYSNLNDVKKIARKEKAYGIVVGDGKSLWEKTCIPVFRPLLPCIWLKKRIPKY